MEGEWFGLTCGKVCTRLLSAKTLTSPGSPRWILGSWLFDSLRFSDRWKVSHLSRVHQMSEGREKKMEPSAVSSLVSASTHSIIRVAPSDCLHSSLYHPAEAVLLQLAFRVGNNQRKTIHLGLFIQKNLWKSEQSMHEWPCAIWIWTTGCAYEALTCELFLL